MSSNGVLDGWIDEPDPRKEMEVRLRPAYLRAEGVLDDWATVVAGKLDRGVTEGEVRRMFHQGLIPLSGMAAFPGIRISRAHTMLAQASEHARGVVPPWALAKGSTAVDAYLARHHKVAAELVRNSPDLDLAGLLSPDSRARGPLDLSKLDAREQRMLALLAPMAFGNNPATPFPMRFTANRVRISAQIHFDRQELAGMQGKPSDDRAATTPRAGDLV